MLIAANVYLQQATNIPVVTFLGRWGSYKTLCAVATANYLLKTKRFEAVYANLPVSFASTPPVKPDEFDFRADYARNKIFIIDEAWQSFGTYDVKLIRDIFAFPRHRNQAFLLTSALPLPNIRAYSHFFVEKHFNYQILLMPLVGMQCHSDKDKKPSKFFIAFPSMWFGRYSTKFDAETMSPIAQYRDSGVLYNIRSQPIPREASQFFYLNQWGLAEKRDNLNPHEDKIASMFEARFDVADQVNAIFDIPKVKRKRKLSMQNMFSTEFSVSFALVFVMIAYVLLSSMIYAWHFSPDNPRILSCNNSVKSFLLMRSFDLRTCVEGGVNENTTRKMVTFPPPTETATIQPTVGATIAPTATTELPTATSTVWNFQKSVDY